MDRDARSLGLAAALCAALVIAGSPTQADVIQVSLWNYSLDGSADGVHTYVQPGFAWNFADWVGISEPDTVIESLTLQFSDYEGTGGGGPGPDFEFSLFSPGGVELYLGAFSFTEPGPASGSRMVTSATHSAFDGFVTDPDFLNFWGSGYGAFDFTTSNLGSSPQIEGVGIFDLVITTSTGPAVIPEPATVFLFGSGLLGLVMAGARYRRRKHGTPLG
jgi:hypothetical protein